MNLEIWVALGLILKRVRVDLETCVSPGVDFGWILKVGCQLGGGSWLDLETCVGPGVDLDLETLVPIGGWILGGSSNLVWVLGGS